MVMQKHIINRGRRRHIPESFSWVDHRFVRDRYITRCSHAALSLYLLLVTVADADGLSYYADSSAAQLLNMSEGDLRSARSELCGAGLISYSRPLYQVLSLDRPVVAAGAHSPGGAQ
jgi:hypothetical protein